MGSEWERLLAKAEEERTEREADAAAESAQRHAAAEDAAAQIRQRTAELSREARSLLPEVQKAVSALIEVDGGGRPAKAWTPPASYMTLQREYEKGWFGMRFVGWSCSVGGPAAVRISRQGTVSVKARGDSYRIEALVNTGLIRWYTHWSDSRESGSTLHEVKADEVCRDLIKCIATYVANL